MATYISTFNFTREGVHAIRETCKRAEAFKAAATKMGVKATGIYWTLGPHDGVLVFEAPDDETATAAMLHVAEQGNVHTSTTRAFGVDEMQAILRKLPQ